MLAAIPAWNSQGLLPPVDPNDPVSLDRSPYVVSLVEVMRRFSTSTERKEILDGFLRYRAALHATGLEDGFQWLNGSFLEHKEERLRLAPGDIDVVTFYRVPEGETQQTVFARNPWLFADQFHQERKDQLHVDTYLQSLTARPEQLIFMSNYWYGMWSHQRDTFRWKGFLQVPLSSAEDGPAHTFLASVSGGATP